MAFEHGRSSKAAAATRCNTSGSDDTSSNTTNNLMKNRHPNAIIYMILLAIQFGIQPIITRRYTSSTINKSTVILVQEIIKFIMAYGMLLLSGETSTATQGTTTQATFLFSHTKTYIFTLNTYRNMSHLLFTFCISLCHEQVGM